MKLETLVLTNKKFVAGLTATVFVAASLLSLAMMHADPSLKMGLGLTPEGGCAMALMNDAPCLMSINDHLEMWQKTFTAIFTGAVLFTLLSFIFVRSLSRCFRRASIYDTGPLTTRQHYQNKNPLDKMFSYLEQLFSSGILHTRVYA